MQRMEIELPNRIGLILSLQLQQVSYILTAIFFLNFIIDSPNLNMDYFKLTRMSKNFSFDLCSYFECQKKDSNSLTYMVAFNIGMLLLLFFQAIFLISKSFRAILLKNCYRWQVYYCIILQRVLYNFMIIMSIMLFQPISLYEYDLSNNIRNIWFILASLVGVLMMVLTLKYHVVVNDVLGIQLLFKLLTGKEIKAPDEQLFGRDKIYHICRNPYRGGLFLLVLFANSTWNVGKIIYIMIFIFFMYVESANEEIYYYQKFEQYKWYVNSITNKFYGISVKKLVVPSKKGK